MFKLVALCALFAVAAAEPGFVATPLTYSTIGAPLAYKTIAAPASYYNPIGGYIAPSVYSTPYGYSHLIKKRSAPFAYSSYIAPTTYLASAPLTTTYSAPVVSSSFYPYNSPIAYSTAAHFIKKRSVIPTTYIAPTYAANTPYLTNAYSSPLYSTPYVAATPFGYAHYIKKSIEHWLKTGRRHSDVLEEQKHSEGQLRRPGATIVLWLKCEQSVHDERLNARVDSMVKEGLISELLEFHKEHNRQRTNDGTPPDYTKGVFQTLGFKEFHEFLMLPEEERNSEKGKKLLEQGIENTKMATRRYARKQNNMVLGRFLESPRREVPPIFVLDTTDVSKWDEEVKNKAIKIIESFLNKSQCPFEPLQPQSREEKEKINSHSSNYCEVCERLIIGDKEFEIHMKSYRHSRALKAKAKLAKLQNAPKDTKE